MPRMKYTYNQKAMIEAIIMKRMPSWADDCKLKFKLHFSLKTSWEKTRRSRKWTQLDTARCLKMKRTSLCEDIRLGKTVVIHSYLVVKSKRKALKEMYKLRAEDEFEKEVKKRALEQGITQKECRRRLDAEIDKSNMESMSEAEEIERWTNDKSN